MRAPVVLVAASFFIVGAGLPCRTLADVVVEVPDAIGTYVGYEAGRSVTIDFGQPLTAVLGLRIQWRGTNTAGVASCDGQAPGAWYGDLHCLINDDDITRGTATGPLAQGGAFDQESLFWCLDGYGFLSDGIMHVVFSLGDNAVNCWDSLQVLTPPQCTLDQVTVTAVMVVPAISTTWGAVKGFYGR